MELQTGVFGKRVELLHEAVPGLRTCLVLVSEANPIYGPGTPWANDLVALGRKLGIDLVVGPITAENVADVIASAAANIQGLVGPDEGVTNARRKAIVEAAFKHKLPTAFGLRIMAEAGCLISYSARMADLSRRAAFFVDRILKGANPADLPIELPTTFEFIINIKTARMLGINMPPMLLARADEVIE
jgi:putative ABC transport system substrate-binding protein